MEATPTTPITMSSILSSQKSSRRKPKSGRFRDRVLNWVSPRRRKGAAGRRHSHQSGQGSGNKDTSQQVEGIHSPATSDLVVDNNSQHSHTESQDIDDIFGSSENKEYRNDNALDGIPTTLLERLVDWCRHEDKLHRTRQLGTSRDKEIEDMSMRLFAVIGGTREMVDWNDDQRQNLEPHDDELGLHSKRIERDGRDYDNCISQVQQYVDELTSQQGQISSHIRNMEDSHEKSRLEIFAALEKQWPNFRHDSQASPLPSAFENHLPFELAEIEAYEREIKEFVKQTRGEEPIQKKLPDPAPDGWVNFVYAMEDRKKEHEAEMDRLKELQDRQSHESCETSRDLSELLREQEGVVSRTKESLQLAIEQCRRVDVHCTETGSVIVNGPGLAFWDLSRHGHEKIIGYIDDDYRVTLYDVDEEGNVIPPTQEDLDARLAQTAESTEQWLEGGHIQTNPESAGAVTPGTPWSIEFQQKLKDVEVGEAFCKE